MKRSTNRPGKVPLDLIEQARPLVMSRVQNSAHVGKTDGNWFRIENKKGSAEASVYIYDEIGYWGVSASTFSKELRDLDVETIHLHINSPGGEIFDGVAIYNTLVDHKAHIIVHVDGLAASAASFIAQAGDEVIMGFGSTMMVHEGSGGCWGNAEDMYQTGKVLDGLSNTIAAFYANRAGGDVATWRGIMKEEAWYNAEEAVAAGLADRVGGAKEDEAGAESEAIEDHWNLSVFNYAGRGAAPAPDLVLQTVMNRVNKEKPVAVKIVNTNTEGEVPVIPAPPAPPVVPADEPDVEVEVEEEDEVGEQEPVVTPPPANLAGLVVVINGIKTSDPRAVQAHIDTLETFAKESKAAGRESFVRNLATAGKMGAPQVDGQLALANTLTDAQWETFKASWDAAPKLPMFGKHGVQDSSEPKSEKADRLKVVQGIVKHHRDSGMSESILMTKDSYAEMVSLQADLGINES